MVESQTAEPFVFTAAGDYGSSDAALATLDLVVTSQARFHLALGDLSYGDEPEPAWCNWVRARVGPPTFPFLLVAGNHEDDFGEHGHIAAFSECLPDRIGTSGRYGREYYFDGPLAEHDRLPGRAPADASVGIPQSAEPMFSAIV